MKLFLVCLLCNVNATLFAQQKEMVQIKVKPTFKNQPVQFHHQYYHLSAKDSIVFETIKGYFTQFSFLEKGKIIFTENESYHLIDASADSSLQIKISIPANLIFDSIYFAIGIDSSTNVSGAMGGDLDPAKAMYWTWQSGYINFKLEGKSNLCTTRKNEFQFHLGGFSGVDNCLQQFYFPVKNQRSISIEIALDKFFEMIDLSKQNDVVIPGKEAVELAKKLGLSIQVKTQ